MRFKRTGSLTSQLLWQHYIASMTCPHNLRNLIIIHKAKQSIQLHQGYVKIIKRRKEYIHRTRGDDIFFFNYLNL